VVSFGLNFYSGCGLKSVPEVKWRLPNPLAEYVPADVGMLAMVFLALHVTPHAVLSKPSAQHRPIF
jgi:hypothetical protein